MGLINWFKDKAFQEVEHAVKLLQVDIQAINLRIDNLETAIRSLRTKFSQKRAEQPPLDLDESELTDEEKEFIAGMPEQERQRFFKDKTF